MEPGLLGGFGSSCVLQVNMSFEKLYVATLFPIIVQQKTTLPVLNCNLLVGQDFLQE